MEVFINQMRKRTQQGDLTNLDMSSWVHFFCFDCLGELNVSKMFGFMERGVDLNGMIEGSDRILIKTGLVSTSNIVAVKGASLTPMIVRTSPFASVDTMDQGEWLEAERAESRIESLSVLYIFRVKVITQSCSTRLPLSANDSRNPLIVPICSTTSSSSGRLIQVNSLLETLRGQYISICQLAILEDNPTDELTDNSCSMAGHDVLAVTLRAILYYVARAPRVEKKLRTELATLELHHTLSSSVPYAKLTKLSYL